MIHLEFTRTDDNTTVLTINNRIELTQVVKESVKADNYEYECIFQDKVHPERDCSTAHTNTLEYLKKEYNYDKFSGTLMNFGRLTGFYQLRENYKELLDCLDWIYLIAFNHRNFPYQEVMMNDNYCILFAGVSENAKPNYALLYYELEGGNSYKYNDNKVEYFYGETAADAMNELLANKDNDVLDAVLSFL